MKSINKLIRGAFFVSALVWSTGCFAHGDEAPVAKNRLFAPVISEENNIPRHEITVLDSTISYLEEGEGEGEGEGEVVVFVHGNPSSAYLWRNIIPFVSETHRTIALDLIGMGHSGKPDITYTFEDHFKYLVAFLDAMKLDQFTLVAHDWGAALAWEYARQYPQKVKRLAFMEGVLPPTFPKETFDALGKEMGNMFRTFKDQEQGRELIIEQNLFVEQILPAMINRPLGHEAKHEYGAPYLNKKDRLPTLQWPREVPIEGKPERNVNLMHNISAFMGQTEMPVLLAYAEPGILIPPQAVKWYTDKIKDLETVFVGQGLHFIQEDQPVAIGRALQDWLRRH